MVLPIYVGRNYLWEGVALPVFEGGKYVCICIYGAVGGVYNWLVVFVTDL